MFEASDNPFAIRPQGRYRSLIASLKCLFVVAVLLAVVLVAQSQTRQWLLSRWMSGMADLSAEQQIERLKQIHALGDLATETLAQQIAAADPAVAATAYELVRERQSAWSLREDDELARAHGRMLAGLAAIADELSADRLPWVTELINQTILECVDQRGQAMHRTYAQANELAAQLGTSDGPVGELSLADAADEDLPPPSLVPLPVRMQHLDDGSHAGSAVSQPKPTISAAEANRPVVVARPGPAPVAVTALETRSLADAAPAATVKETKEEAARGEPERRKRWRGTAESEATQTLVAAGALQAVHRVATEEPTAAPATAVQPRPQELASDRPLQTLSTRRVIAELASKQAAVADQAVAELTRRGLSKEEIRIAAQLASPQREVRLGLLESLARRTDIDIRPWLLWLAEDREQAVRLQAVTALAPLADAAVKQTLRKRLEAESDPAIAAQLQQIVDRR